MSRYGARASYMIARDKAQDRADLRRATQAAENAAKKNKIASTIGRTVGMVAGVAAAPFTGGASLAATAALAGAGSYIGSKIGDVAVGGEDTLDYKGRFYKQESRDIQEGLTEANKAEELNRVVSAGMDAFSVFTLGGGGEAFKAGAKGAEGASMWSKFKAGSQAVADKQVTGGELFQNLLSNYGIEKGKGKVTKEVASNISEGYMGSEISDGFSTMMQKRLQTQLKNTLTDLAPDEPDSLFYPKLGI